MENIFIVEADLRKTEAFVEALDGEYKISFYQTWQEAKVVLQHKIPGMIVIEDCKPEVDVLAVLDWLHRIDVLAHVPVVVFSDGQDETFESKCIRLGAADFIFRPCSKVGIRSRVKRVLAMEKYEKKMVQEIAGVDEMLDMAKRDPLTKLWNRNYGEQAINTFLSERRNHGALLMIDMDNFKEINDSYGHIVGDEVLVEFANTLQALTRKDDVVCRLGGDEFVVFLKDVNVHSVIIEKVEQIMVTLEERISKPNNGGQISVSTGIAVSPIDGRSFNQLYQNADKALYYVKQNSKGAYLFFSEEGSLEARHLKQKNTQVDLDHLKCFIQEVGYKKGAYQVEYDGFKKIYRFIARCIGRTKQEVQTVLFTLKSEKDTLPDMQEIIFSMDNLKNAVHESIRRGDVATNYSNSQFVVILMDSSLENADMVANRICQKYNQLHSYSPDIVLTYDIKSVTAAPLCNDF